MAPYPHTDVPLGRSNRLPYRPRPFLRPFEWVLAVLLFVSALTTGTALLYQANSATLVDIPRRGGVHVEGIIGSPRFINPLLAVSDADNDLTTLVYAGLLAPAPDGTLVPELAERYSISDDGRTYSFMLRENLTFHDGTALTTADVAFTIKLAQDALLKSPKFLNWDGVEVVVHNEREIDLILAEPYAPFIENTTLGVLPKHIWGELGPDEVPFSQFNSTPIGSGPYAIARVARDTGGIPVRYELTAFDRYVLGTPHVTTLAFNLYRNSTEVLNAFARGDVDGVHSVPNDMLEGLVNSPSKSSIIRAPHLRVFALFLNHNRQPLFLRNEVADALRATVPKRTIVSSVLGGYGTVLEGPIPPGLLGYRELPNDTAGPATTTEVLVNEARTRLEAGGWQRGDGGIYERTSDDKTTRLSLALTTANTPELVRASEIVAAAWRDLGAEVELKVFDPSDLTQSVIRPRRFDALLFGIVVGRELDLYAFWHSSQRNDPGLNIAQYADIDADSLLSRARAATSSEARMELHRQFDALLARSNSVIFLYSPDFTYLVRDTLHGVRFAHVTTPSDRFTDVHTWYKETDRVWPFIERLVR